MALPWKSWMEGRIQDKEIRKFLDGAVPQTAYGGMRYRNDTPPNVNIGTTPQKITLFNESLPTGAPSVNVTFDQPNSYLTVNPNQAGVYSYVFYLNFQGEQGEVYTVQARVDDGQGDVPIGDPLYVRVASNDPYAELERSSMAFVSSNWKISLWINANKANTKFNVFTVAFELMRISPQMPDVPAVQARGLPSPPQPMDELFLDAPDDGQLYVRRHGEWVLFEDAEEEVDD